MSSINLLAILLLISTVAVVFLIGLVVHYKTLYQTEFSHHVKAVELTRDIARMKTVIRNIPIPRDRKSNALEDMGYYDEE